VEGLTNRQPSKHAMAPSGPISVDCIPLGKATKSFCPAALPLLKIAHYYLLMARDDQPMPRWSIYAATGTPAKLLGTVEAPDADAAIKIAIEELKVEPARQWRLIAVRRP
jgi:hypothetical protein